MVKAHLLCVSLSYEIDYSKDRPSLPFTIQNRCECENMSKGWVPSDYEQFQNQDDIANRNSREFALLERNTDFRDDSAPNVENNVGNNVENIEDLRDQEPLVPSNTSYQYPKQKKKDFRFVLVMIGLFLGFFAVSSESCHIWSCMEKNSQLI